MRVFWAVRAKVELCPRFRTVLRMLYLNLPQVSAQGALRDRSGGRLCSILEKGGYRQRIPASGERRVAIRASIAERADHDLGVVSDYLASMLVADFAFFSLCKNK